jgi:hypothetical protein
MEDITSYAESNIDEDFFLEKLFILRMKMIRKKEKKRR